MKSDNAIWNGTSIFVGIIVAIAAFVRGALLLPPNVCHELPFVQAPCLMLGFSAANDGQAVFEFPQLQGTPAWMFLLLLYSEQTTATARTPLLEALLMQMAPMAHGFELCAPDAAFSLATEVLQHLNLCFAEELSLTELTNRFHISTSHMIHMFMGNKKCINISTFCAETLKSLLNSLLTDTCIDQNMCIIICCIQTVAAAAAGNC